MIIEGKNHFFQFHEHWSQLLGGCNWYTFHFWMLELEWERSMGGVEVTFTLLGLGVRWRWNYTVTEKAQDLADRIADVRSRLDDGESFSDIYASKRASKGSEQTHGDE